MRFYTLGYKQEHRIVIIIVICFLDGELMYLSLLQCDCSINISDSNGDTPLHYCSEVGTYPIASFLVARGADVNIRNKSGKSPLELAELWKLNDIVELLKKAMLEGPQGMLIACFNSTLSHTNSAVYRPSDHSTHPFPFHTHTIGSPVNSCPNSWGPSWQLQAFSVHRGQQYSLD